MDICKEYPIGTKVRLREKNEAIGYIYGYHETKDIICIKFFEKGIGHDGKRILVDESGNYIKDESGSCWFYCTVNFNHKFSKMKNQQLEFNFKE